MKSEGWAPLWVDADSKKCEICVVQMTKKPGRLFLLYTLSTQGTTSLGQAVHTYVLLNNKYVQEILKDQKSRNRFFILQSMKLN